MAILDDLKEILKAEVSDRVDVDNLSPDESLSDAGIDSLDMSSVFMNIEDKFGITIPDSDTSKLISLAKIEEYIAAQKS